MARAILAIYCNWQCQNGLSHSSNILQLAVPQWLEPFWHSNIAYMAVPEWLKPLWHSNIVGSARMAQAIMALEYCWQCQNGSSHSCTQVMPLAELECQNGSSHSPAQPCRLHDLSARMARAILALKYCNCQCHNGSSHSGTQILHI